MVSDFEKDDLVEAPQYLVSNWEVPLAWNTMADDG